MFHLCRMITVIAFVAIFTFYNGPAWQIRIVSLLCLLFIRWIIPMPKGTK